MFNTLRRHVALQTLVFRASVLFVVVHVLLSFLGVLAEASFANPAGVIILATVLGAMDLRRRREITLWANLGYEQWFTWAIYGAVGLAGEALSAAAFAIRK